LPPFNEARAASSARASGLQGPVETTHPHRSERPAGRSAPALGRHGLFYRARLQTARTALDPVRGRAHAGRWPGPRRPRPM